MKKLLATGICFFSLLMVQCSLIEPFDIPTKTKMEGTWQVVEAYDQDGTSILDKIQFPTTIFKLDNYNDIQSTAGPALMYIVYGSSNYTTLASKFDQFFDYLKFNFTDGEWFIKDGMVDRFTIEMKLMGAPGLKTISEILEYVNIYTPQLMKPIIYHKFLNVKVTFDAWTDTIMTWELDNNTTAEYNIKDSEGKYVLWNGYPATSFRKCKFIMHRRISNMEDLIRQAKTY